MGSARLAEPATRRRGSPGKKQEVEGCLVHHLEAEREQPESAEARLSTASTLWFSLHDKERCLEKLKEALTLEVGRGLVFHRGQLLLGTVALAEGDVRAAARHLLLSLEIDEPERPPEATPNFALVEALLKRGAELEACAAYLGAVRRWTEAGARELLPLVERIEAKLARARSRSGSLSG